MKLPTAALLLLGFASLAQPGLAQNKLTQGQSGAKFILAEYGYHSVDVSKLNPTQLAQIQFLAGTSSGVGRIRGQIGAILRQSHIYNPSKRRY